MSPPLLAVRGVTKRFVDVVAVDDVSFEVHRGEVFGLLGPNGAGKTTLIRTLLDVYRPDSGEIELFGRPSERDMLDRIGYLPEERGLYQRRTVLQVLTYLGRLRGLGRRGARDAALRGLQRLGMESVANAKVRSLSKGNQQKIQLLGTLLGEPELIVWDEPFSGLDPVNVRQVRDLLLELQAAGTTVILSTHLMRQAESLCSRVALIHRGRLALCGSVDELVTAGRDLESLFVEVAGV